MVYLAPRPRATGVKSSLLVFLTKIAQTAASILATIIIGRTIGPYGAGLYGVAFATVNVITSFSSLGMYRSITVLYAAKKYDDRVFFGNAISVWLMGASLGAAAVGLGFLSGPATTYGWAALWPAVVCVAPLLLIDYGNGVFLAKERINSFNLTSLARYGIFVAALAAALILFDAGPNGITLAYLVGCAAGAAVPVVLLRKIAWTVPRFDREVVREFLMLGGQYALGALVMALNYRVSVLILERFVAPERVGLFAAGINLAEALWQLPNAVGTVLVSKSANTKCVEEAVRRSCRMLRVTLPVTAFCGLAVGVLAMPLLHLFFGSKLSDPVQSHEAMIATWIMLPGVVLGVIYKVLSSDLAGRGKPLFAARSYIWAVGANVAVGLWLISGLQMGAIGAAIASSVGYAIGAVLFLREYVREHGLSLGDVFRFQPGDFAFRGRR